MSAWGLDWVCGGCSIKHLVSHTVFLASKSRENRRKQPHFCQRNSAPLFLNIGGYFRKTKKSHPHLRFVWLTLPRSGTFISNDDFLDHHRPEAKEADRRPITKKCGSPPWRSPCWGSSFAKTSFRSFYWILKSLKISFIASLVVAISIASMKAIVSFSKMLSSRFFFFSSLRFRLCVCLKAE